MNTKRIDSVSGEPLASGYKILNWDYTASNGDGYCYADENGKIEGTIHTTDGALDPCKNGLHFCKNPFDCTKYYPPVQWNKFCKVTAFDEITEADDGKSVCRTLRIDREMTFSEYIDELKKYSANVKNDIYGGSDIRGGSVIYGGRSIYGGSDIRGGSVIYGGRSIYGGSDIRGGRSIYGGSNIRYCTDCEGVSRCLCCADIEGARLMLFNKPISEERFAEVKNNIDRLAGAWHPNFTNAEELREKYGKGEWEATPASAIKVRSAKEAYADMPDKLVKYIKSLPEYDEAVWNKITGAEE